ncbi:MAG: LytTR family transcriptional regulator DNA-binding domain-containing protein, partial [Streptococcus mitis]|nr:LytTR family transcriptional regulator DNA-binding domain-containing protein [Streptococcus mitis]
HRNCLVNLDKVKSIDFQERILFLGEEGQYAVKYSRRRYREIRQKWLKEGE